MSTEDLVNRLAELLQRQHDSMEEERLEGKKREEKMQILLETALAKVPEINRSESKIPSNATPAPVLVHNASLREFTTWRQKFTDYILLTGVSKASNDRQKAVLRSLLDDEWFRITKFALNIKMEDVNTTVETIMTQMQEHLRSQRNIVLDRKEFYSRNQQPDEKFDDYYIALQEIAAFCDFCQNCINQQYRDRIVTGIHQEDTVKDLLSEKDLTLEKAVAICRANENASNDTESLSATASGINRVSKYKKPDPQQYQRVDNTNENRFSRIQPWRGRGNPQRYSRMQPDQRDSRPQFVRYQPDQRDHRNYYERNKPPDKKYGASGEHFNEKILCEFCGRWHVRNQCPARYQDCAKCGKKGHYARVCINTVSDEDEEEYEEDNAWRITVAGVNETSLWKKTPKIVISADYSGNECKLEATPDTGAEMSVIGTEQAQKLGANVDNLKPSSHKLYAADRKKLTCLGVIPVTLKLGEQTTDANLVVVSEIKGFLLSWYHAKELKILPECFPEQICKVSEQDVRNEIRPTKPPICPDKYPSIKTRQEHERQLKENFKSVFEIEEKLQPMQGKPMRILLTEDAIPFALTSPRSLPFAWKEQIKNQLDEMLQKNIIKEVTGPTDWCHPMVPVAKKNSKEVRLCVDLTRLNQFVRRGAHPVLTPHEAVSSIAKGSRFFAKMDAHAGYWQVPIAESDQELTTFITPWGRYKFLRAPMGLSISGDEYNRRGDEALQSIKNTVKIVDDILVFDDDYQQHLNNVWEVLNKCKENKITLNLKKFHFAQDEVDYCGYHLNKDGFAPDKDKLSAIIKFEAPTNITELRSFLGLVNQLSQFSSEISTVAEPLRHLLKKNHEWTWSADHENSFAKVKEALSSPPILAYYDPKLPVKLETDAARLKGLGYACLQQHGNSWKLVDCGSRFLADREYMYATIDLEMLAIGQ